MGDKNNLKKIVLTGGGCCGKTTLINELEKRGYNVLHEVAREVLSERKYSRNNDCESLQREIFYRQLKKESTIDGLTFMDRSAVDGIAYTKLFLGIVPDFFKVHELKNNYDQVFLLDRLPLINDGIRVELDDNDAQLIHDKVEQVYCELGYSPIKVPVFEGNFKDSLDRRADFILNSISELSCQ